MAAILWLNDLPVWASILVLVGGAISLSIIGTAVSGIFFGEEQLSLNNIVGGYKYLFISSVYASFWAFCCTEPITVSTPRAPTWSPRWPRERGHITAR